MDTLKNRKNNWLYVVVLSLTLLACSLTPASTTSPQRLSDEDEEEIQERVAEAVAEELEDLDIEVEEIDTELTAQPPMQLPIPPPPSSGSGSGSGTGGPAPEPTPTAAPVEPPPTQVIGPGKIVFTCYIDSIDQICIMDGDGDNQRQLTDVGATNWYGSLSPDGEYISFSTRRDGVFDLYLMSASGASPTRITESQGAYGSEISPDMRQIVFAAGFEAGEQEIFVIDIDGSDIRQLTDLGGDTVNPSWSPDGRQILFTSNHSGTMQLYIMDADGSDLTKMTTDGVLGRPDWSPDGQLLAFSAGRQGEEEIYIMSAGGGSPVQVTDGGSNRSPSFSPDSEWVAFASKVDGDNEIVIIRLDGSGRKQLTNNDRPDWQPRWGP
jgi:dipeptidyl aminopeptidase/acylaminoacyl peptidase